MEVTVYQVDAFTTEKFTGNPAGVVIDADNLSENQMQKIARELNNSETAFLLRAEDDSHDFGIRYFTPTVEVPSCGHATIASHYVRSLVLNLNPGNYKHKIKIGVLDADISKDEHGTKVIMTQGSPQFLDVLNDNQTERLYKGLGLSKNDVAEGLPHQIVDTGHSKVMVAIKSRNKLHSIEPDQLTLSELSREINCNGYYVFTTDAEADDYFAHGRMFAPVIDIKEDPVTGNANGPMGAYAVKYGLVKPAGEIVRLKTKQGEKMGRPGTAYIEVTHNNGTPAKVRVGGYAVSVFKTVIEI